MDNFFSSSRLFDDLDRRKINSCGTAQPNRGHAPWLWTKATETEKGWCKGENQGRFERISLEGQTRCLHANMDQPPAEGNFCDDSNPPMKPHIVERYNRHMGYVDSSDRKANSYSVRPRTFKWTTKLFFHLLDLTVLNSWILSSSCRAKHTHRDFRLLLLRNLIEETGKSQDRPALRFVGRPSAAAMNSVRLESRHNQQRPAKSSAQLPCRLC